MKTSQQKILFPAFLIGALSLCWSATSALADSDQQNKANAPDAKVQQAISFLQAACVTKGTSLDLKASGDGSLQVSKILTSGINGSVTLSKKELEGFADAASELSVKQASEMRECMKPYIDKIINALLTGTAEGFPKEVVIQTGGGYFVADEFDKLLIVMQQTPNDNLTLYDIAKKSGLAIGKVFIYSDVAIKNQLATGIYPDHAKITLKGLNYIYSRMKQ
jgi:hypothetical protein